MEPFSGISLIGLSLAQITFEGLCELPAFLGHKLGEDYAKEISKHAIESVLRRAKDTEPAANHDLQRATRRSSLLATTVMVRHFRQHAVKNWHGSDWIDWCDRMTEWLKEEVRATRGDKYRVPPSPADGKCAELVAHGEHPLETLGGELQRIVIADVQDELRQWHAREWSPTHPNFPEPHPDFLKWVADGWPYVEESKTLGQKVVAVFTRRHGSGPEMHRHSQAALLPATETGQTLHWFSLFAAFFTEELKTNNRVHTIFDAKLLTEINDRIKKAAPGAPACTTEQLGTLLRGALEQWGHQFCEKLDELHRLVRDSQTEMRDQLAQVLDQLATLVTVTERNEAVRAGLARLEQKLDTVKKDTRAIRDGVVQLLDTIAQLKADLAGKHLKLSDLTREQLERELAARFPNFKEADLHRLILYAQFKCDISHFDVFKYAPVDLIGRDDEKKLLSDAWDKAVREEKGRPHILTFVALGGEGKTSLVAKWAAELAAQDWPGCDAVFAWSFYSQGTREQLAASSDLFLKEALTFFGDDADKQFATSPAGAFEKGQRLARLVGQRRSLLILDGIEPLQYAPTSPTPGQLKDQGIAALLKGLAAASHGLCVVTTRYSLPDLKAFWQTTAHEKELKRLSKEAGVALLRSFKAGTEEKPIKIRGTQAEFEQLVEDLKGHALCLTLLGSYLVRFHVGDIRKRDLVKLEKADGDHHAFHIMDAYVRSLAPSGFRAWLRRLFNPQERETQIQGRRAVAVLRLLGLFDRPADAGCLAALRRETIPGLTEPLAGLADGDWEYCLNGLETAKLLTVNRDASGTLVSLDAHPLVREYFARQLCTQQPDAWRAAHLRLYKHLCAITKEGNQPTLEGLQPLYQAVTHGCQAQNYRSAFKSVLLERILKGTFGPNAFFATKKLGAYGSQLSAVACFFDAPRGTPTGMLAIEDQAWILNEAGCCLRTLGRLNEAVAPLQASLRIRCETRSWDQASVTAAHLAEIHQILGGLASALSCAEAAVGFSFKDRDNGSTLKKARPYRQRDNKALLGIVYHQLGRRDAAFSAFKDAERIQSNMRHNPPPERRPHLYGIQGFQYCSFLLSHVEQNPWRIFWDLVRFPLQKRPSGKIQFRCVLSLKM